MSSKKVSRREFLAAAGALSAGTLIAACAPAATPVAAPQATEAPKAAAPATEPVTIRVHCVKKEDVSDWIQTGLDTDIDGFKSKNPNIKVSLETIPGWTAEYNPKILSFAAAGTIGDLMWYPPRHRSHIAWAVQYDIVRDLLPLAANAKYQMDQNFYQGAIDVNTYQGKMYWMSYISEPAVPVIAYNKTALKKLGVEEPNDEWTFDELMDWAKKATTPDAFAYSEADRRAVSFSGLPYLRQWGIEPVDKDGKKATFADYRDQLTKALQFSMDLITNKYSPSPTAGAINDPEMFGGSKVLAVDIWPFRIQIYPTTFKNIEIGFVLTPVVKKGDKRRSLLNEHVFGITNGSKNPDAAFTFLTWIAGKEMNVQALVQGHKGPIARADVWADQRIYANNPTYTKLKPVMDTIEADFLVGNWRGEEFDTAIQAVYDAMELGKVSPADAVDQMQKEAQTVLDKEAA